MFRAGQKCVLLIEVTEWTRMARLLTQGSEHPSNLIDVKTNFPVD